jgi:DNA-binding transcriptional LysR family regulator
MALKQLEQTMKAPLFDRIGKQLKLNHYGQQVLPQAIEMVTRAQSFANNTLLKGNVLTGDLHIGCSQTIGNYLLPAYLARFKHQYSHIECHQNINNTDQILANLKAFKSDFALIEGFNDLDPHFTYKTWHNDPVTLIARNQHPLAHKQNITLRDLEAYHWVLREKGSGTAALIENKARSQFALSIETRLTSFEAIKQYVANSDCLSCLSQSALQNNTALIALNTPHLSCSRPLYFVMRKNGYLSEPCKAFMDFIFQT